MSEGTEENNDGSDASEAPGSVAVVGDWRKDGRCSACMHFGADFGEPPELFGHCKMYPRQGARGSADYACDEYRALPGFAKLTNAVTFETRLELDHAKGIASARGSRSGGARRTRRSAGSKGSRRRGPDGEPLRAASRVPRKITSDVLAMFTGSNDDDDEATTMDPNELRDVLIDVLENFIGIEDADLGDKWHGGTMTLQPSDPEMKPHVIGVESFFHKVVMIRDRLRVLEQKVNANSKLSDLEKVDMQQYISRCYGSLTTLNVLFKHKNEKFTSK